MALIYSTQQLTEVRANSGSPIDIQNAVDEATAMEGGTVVVPEGTWDFPLEGNHMQQTGISGKLAAVINRGKVNIVGMGIGRTILSVPTPPPTDYQRYMFFLDGGTTYDASKISGITFKGLGVGRAEADWTGYCIWIRHMVDFRVNHCEFLDFYKYAIQIGETWNGKKGRGLVDHCTFDMPSKVQYPTVRWGYAVGITGSWDSYIDDPKLLLGKYETIPDVVPVVYVEDCKATRLRYLVASNQGGWYVARHNKVSMMMGSTPPAAFDVHEGYADYDMHGGNGGEFYNNEIEYGYHPEGWEMNGFQLRAGGGVVYNNILRNLRGNVWLLLMSEACKANRGNHVHDLYVWNNNLINTIENVYTNNLGVDFFQENTHYFLRAPNLAQDGIDYKPYPYPHPLTLEEPLPPENVTPWTGELEEGLYRITMPPEVVIDGETYRFVQWEDGTTDPTRYINVPGLPVITATYELKPTPISPLVIAGGVVATIIIGGTIYYLVKKRRG